MRTILSGLGVAFTVIAVLEIGKLDLDSAQVTEALVAESEARFAVEPLFLHPLCPDQWVAQRGAGERWRLKCILASTEGSRADQ